LTAAVATNKPGVVQTRSENLAFTFQEVLTAITRLRTNRQSASDAGIFRTQVKEALGLAEREAKVLGYTPDTIRLAVFAAVAFIDESVLNQPAPIFADWARKPLQEELFGVHVAGEIFFDNLQRLLVRSDSAETADLLEVYELCLLLGYRGRYGAAAKGELVALMHAVDEKIGRVRVRLKDLSPSWRLPSSEDVPLQPDRWSRGLIFAFLTCFLLAMLLFIGFRLSLSSGVSGLRTTASEARKSAL
jgi:type VI secretion system protein ImpK